MKNISFFMTENEGRIIEKIIDNLNGEQITQITVTLLKVGGLYALAYLAGTDGAKSAISLLAKSSMDIDV